MKKYQMSLPQSKVPIVKSYKNGNKYQIEQIEQIEPIVIKLTKSPNSCIYEVEKHHWVDKPKKTSQGKYFLRYMDYESPHPD